MVIAINARFLIPNELEGIGWYSHEICRQLIAQHPEDTFVLFFDRPFAAEWTQWPHVVPLVLAPRSRRYGLWYWWFEWQVFRALRRYRAEVFFSPDNHLCLRTALPTLMTIHDVAFVHYPDMLTRMSRWHYRHFQARYLQRADHLVAVSEFTRQDVLRHFDVAETKITTIWNGPRSGFVPLLEQERAAVRAQYSGGSEYFFYLGSLHPRKNLVGLLQGYTVFRQRHPAAPVKLLIGGRMAWQTSAIQTEWAESPYRDDIIFLGFLDDTDLARVLGAALALTYVSLFEGFGLPLLEAMQAEVPIITSNTSALPEVAGAAALLVDPRNPAAIADAMAQVWQLPALRQQLIAAGQQQRQRFSWEDSAHQVYNLLTKLAQQKN